MQFFGEIARMLRQLADADEIVGQQRADAVDEVVADARPHFSGLLGADVMGHAGGARREDRQVAAALPLQLQLRLDALPQRIVADAEVRRRRPAHRIGEPGQLLVAEPVQRLRLGRVVAVNVDDHADVAVLRERGAGPAWAASIDNKQSGWATMPHL